MQRRGRTTLLVAILGAVIGWVLSDLYSDRIDLPGLPVNGDEQPEEDATAVVPVPGSVTGLAAETAAVDAANVIAVEDITGLVPVIVAPPPSDAVEPEPIALPPANTPVAELRSDSSRVSERSSPDEVADEILSALLNPTDVHCAFGAGNGGNWPTATLNVHDAEWQGGPLLFQAVNLDAGTAQMVGTVGATDSLDGTIDARVIPTDIGLHFLALTPNGYLITTTVFHLRDDSGRFVAVMSRHEGARGAILTEGAQFYGSCD
jgi:hypothetical protein